MVLVCLPLDALSQHLPSYLGFSYLGRGVSLHGCSSKAQLLLLTLDKGYLLTASPPDLERGVAPMTHSFFFLKKKKKPQHAEKRGEMLPPRDNHWIYPSKSTLCTFVLRAVLSSFSRVQPFATPQTVAHQVSTSMRFPLARIVECIAVSSSRGYFQPRSQTHISLCLLHWQVASLPIVPPGRPTVPLASFK